MGSFRSNWYAERRNLDILLSVVFIIVVAPTTNQKISFPLDQSKWLRSPFAENTNFRVRLSTDGLLLNAACFVKKSK
jgi:hypothetical protein